MNRWRERDGVGTYTLSHGYSIKGTFQVNKPIAVEYFDNENKIITKDIFDTQEKKEIAIADEAYKQKAMKAVDSATANLTRNSFVSTAGATFAIHVVAAA